MQPTVASPPETARVAPVRDLVAFIDPLEGEREIKIEINIPGRRTYSGSPVGIKDPIALQYIAAYFERAGYRTTVLLRGLTGSQRIAERMEELRDELAAVCIALHSTYLVPDAVEMAGMIKERVPGVPIIVGGYHPTGDTDVVFMPGIDFAVLNEGEESCLELVRALQDGAGKEELRTVKGLAYLDDAGKKVVTEPRGRLAFGELPWPKREREILELCQPGPLSYPPVGRVAQVSYSRGCPYGCPFCASPNMWNRKVNYRTGEDMAAEMEHLIRDYGVNNFFFCDLSFNGNRKRLMELCDAVERMKERVDVPFGSHVMCTSTIIDETILSAMKRANFWKIDYGIEDVLEGTIGRIKTFQKVERIRSTLDVTNKHGILMRGLMMIGYPWETEETVAAREELIDQFPADQLRICFYTPFKGTAMYEEVKDRIIVGLSGFTTDRPAIRCDGIGTEGLMAAVPRLLQRFYNSDNYVATITEKRARFPELGDAYDHFFNYLHRKGLMTDATHGRLMPSASAAPAVHNGPRGPARDGPGGGGLMADLDALLAATSRTFGLSIPLLPEPARRNVTVAYLLFRIADTLEDADLWPGPARVRALEEWEGLLTHPGPERAQRLAQAWLDPVPCDEPAYLELLAEVPFVLRALDEMDAESRRSVVGHALRTARGMKEYVSRIGDGGVLRVQSVPDLRHYCYVVAGIVGEMLTDQFILGWPSLAPRRAEMVTGSNRFGEGLQLVNILKDAADDEKSGRVYLPADAPVEALFAIARAGLWSGAEYIAGLLDGGAPTGFATFLVVPLFLGWATLEQVEARGAGARASRELVGRVMRTVDERFSRGDPPRTAAALRALYDEITAGVARTAYA